jgi:hypothetical protein
LLKVIHYGIIALYINELENQEWQQKYPTHSMLGC